MIVVIIDQLIFVAPHFENLGNGIKTNTKKTYAIH